MRSLHIGLDFDGVLADSLQIKSDIAKKLYGIDLPGSDFKREIVVVSRGLMTTAQYSELQELAYGSLEYGLTAVPVPGVLEALKRLEESGHHVRIITSRTEGKLAVAKAWCEARGLRLDFTGVGHQKSKATAVAGCDLYVDDDLDKLSPLVGLVPNLYLFTWDYNRHLDASDIAQRVASWDELLEHISELTFSPANP